MSKHYKEIFKLKRMLEKENIPFEFIENFGYGPEMMSLYPELMKAIEHYQICYPDSKTRWISVIEGAGTYGSMVDKLEIMGGLTPLEAYETNDSVIGGLTAHNVFKRIKNHYEKEKLK